MRRIYLDHAATTPLAPEVREAMLPWLDVGNPSSLHAEGRAAKDAIDAAREALSERLGCLFAEVLFTSGGTEAANLAIIGAALANEDPHRTRVLLSAADHHCVLHAQPILERLGYLVEHVPVDRYARLDLHSLEARMGEDVLLVSAMHANNELGTLNDIPAIVIVARTHGAVVHTDAVQSFGKLDWKVDHLGADLITVSSHKINGPKGAGAVYVRAGTKIKPLVGGGGQEREVRGGTENVAAIAGFGVAAQRPLEDCTEARDAFESTLQIGVSTVPTETPRLGSHAHRLFPGVPAETLLIVLDRMGISASSGAACSSGSIEPSHVLLACGYSEEEAREGVRFTFGTGVNVDDAREAADRVQRAVEQISR